jgi:2,3-bisphosphoglycerate-independent phosphoglycerate mutase
MKYIVLLGDGMADEPLEELGGLTPLQKANTPNMDRLASEGELGLAETVPDNFHPGSDVANLSVFGYDPNQCYSGRSPLEAISMGVELGPGDVAFRLNLVHLTAHFGKLYMGDFSAGHIGTEQAGRLIATLQQELGDEHFAFYPGVSYRHLLVWKNGKDKLKMHPPHDISNRCILDHLPQGEGAAELIHLTNSAQMILANHPGNRERADAGELAANSIWLWGQGRAPQMLPYATKFGLSGAVISAVDLIKGIGLYAGLEVINVPGATGYLDTNYRGKVELGLKVIWDRERAIAELEADNEAIRGLKEEISHAAKASTYLARMQVGRLIEAGLEDRSAELLADIYDSLRPLSVASRSNKLIGDNMILNVAVLVERDGEDVFDAAVRALSSRHANLLSFKYTGPWPPYNFVNIKLKLERAE